jgi:hypothetical protein
MRTIVVACLPRIYAGFPYPSDLLAGAALGVGCTLALARWPFANRVVGSILRFENRHRSIFYTGAFLGTYQIATFIWELRRFGSALAKLL